MQATSIRETLGTAATQPRAGQRKEFVAKGGHVRRRDVTSVKHPRRTARDSGISLWPVAVAMVMLITMADAGMAEMQAGGRADDRREADLQKSLVAEAQSQLEAYFRQEVEQIERRTRERLGQVTSAAQWDHVRKQLRAELKDMLGLVDPALFERDRPLHAVVTGSVTRQGVVVEKLHFQSLPHLYVTGNLYRPEKVEGRVPAVLYVCGHGRVKIDGVSYGNKVHYQHHGVWFAQHGYVCLAIDTIQLGEIEGIHHGTYRHGMWWWNARGYTPAGVEAFHAMRAIDYLSRRPEVDPQRIGVTGRSGGGAYSWWVTALDDRIQAAVPVAGITSLRNHVVDDCIEGHCDCMYPVNTYRWDFPLVSALAAPRPLLISNTDKDRIFPLDGVVAVYNETRRLYERLGMLKHVGLNIEEGPHRDTQQLRVSAFHWMNRFLQSRDELIRRPAEPLFTPQELKVFRTLPQDQINTRIHERFVPVHQVVRPENREAWRQRSTKLKEQLRRHVFAGWPAPQPIGVVRVRQGTPNLRGPLQKVLPRVLPRLRQVPRPQAPRLLRRTSHGSPAETVAVSEQKVSVVSRGSRATSAADVRPTAADVQPKPRVRIQTQNGRIEVRVQVGPQARVATSGGRAGAVVLTELATLRTDRLRVDLFELRTQPAVSLPVVWLRRSDKQGKEKRADQRRPEQEAAVGALRMVVLDAARWPDVRTALRTLLADASLRKEGSPLWVRDLVGAVGDRAKSTQDAEGRRPRAQAEGDARGDENGQSASRDIIANWVRWTEEFPSGVLLVAPRGIGPTDWAGDERFRTHIRRRFVLLGQTVDGMRVWDVVCAMEAARHLIGASLQLTADARGTMAVNLLYAQWMHPTARRLELDAATASHADGPIYLNVLRYTDVPEAFASVLLEVPVALRSDDTTLRSYLTDAAKRLELPPDRLIWRE